MEANYFDLWGFSDSNLEGHQIGISVMGIVLRGREDIIAPFGGTALSAE